MDTLRGISRVVTTHPLKAAASALNNKSALYDGLRSLRWISFKSSSKKKLPV